MDTRAPYEREQDEFRERHLQIEPTISKVPLQGFCLHHDKNPHHDVLTKYGWTYTHSTGITALGGVYRYAIHTYKYKDSDWVVGVQCTAGCPAVVGRLGSGHRTTLYKHGLEKYLKRKTKQLKKEGW